MIRKQVCTLTSVAALLGPGCRSACQLIRHAQALMSGSDHAPAQKICKPFLEGEVMQNLESPARLSAQSDVTAESGVPHHTFEQSLFT